MVVRLHPGVPCPKMMTLPSPPDRKPDPINKMELPKDRDSYDY